MHKEVSTFYQSILTLHIWKKIDNLRQAKYYGNIWSLSYQPQTEVTSEVIGTGIYFHHFWFLQSLLRRFHEPFLTHMARGTPHVPQGVLLRIENRTDQLWQKYGAGDDPIDKTTGQVEIN